ncbi:MAG TPA: hypothetical protein VK039_05770, partial [Brevibacterium sp.]|nr:hypothetical protein [Brevibacterium sp.]
DPWLPVRNETYGDGRETDGEVVRLSLEVERLGWERAKDAYPEVRRLLQAYASEAVRDVVGADAWLRLGLDALRVNRDEDMRTVFTDVRFPNEVDALRAHGVRMVYVHRPSASAANGHISERSVTMHDADVVIANDGTIADLQRRIARVAGA